jgi:hypothetical protein
VLALPSQKRIAGTNSFSWSAASIADGRYRVAVTAKAGTKSVSKIAAVTVDRTLSGLTPPLAVVSPNGDGLADSTTFAFNLATAVPLRLDIEQAGLVLTSPFQGELATGAHSLSWDCTANGVPLRDGKYVALFTFTDTLGEVQVPLPVTIDTRPPTLALVDPHTLRFTLDEPATVTVLVNDTTRVVVAEPKGTFTIPFEGSVYDLSAQAQDAGGNLSLAVTA